MEKVEKVKKMKDKKKDKKGNIKRVMVVDKKGNWMQKKYILF